MTFQNSLQNITNIRINLAIGDDHQDLGKPEF